MMNKYKLKELIEKFTGYYFCNINYLPLGVSLKFDIRRRFKYRNVSVIFDVGANTGQSYAKYRSDFSESVIYCFEPINSTFDLLKENVIKNDGFVVLENIAFGNSISYKEVSLFDEWNVLNSLNDTSMNLNINAIKQIVTIDTIDNYCALNNITHVDLIKIDTEGYELQVLEGAKNLIASKSVAFLLVEVGFVKTNERNTSFSKVADYLGDFGYYFVCMYNDAGSELWNDGGYYANALFANSNFKF